MGKLYIIDRIEGDYLVLESPNGEMIDVKKEMVDGEAKEGDCLIKKGNYFFIDAEATIKRKEDIEKMVKGMWQD